jgi:hypothetical protein
MRAILLAALAVPFGFLAASPSFGDDPPTVEKAADAPAAAEPGKIDLPAGFKPKKRGKYTVYCRKEEAMGTRFPVEKCYDEQGIREYVLDQRENQKQVDQMRRICGSMEACGGGG